MRRLPVVLPAIMLMVVSCAREEQMGMAVRAMDQEKKTVQENVPSLVPPARELDDEWSRWLIGEWEISAESDLPGFKSWVKGTGQVKAELGLGGQFLIVTKQGHVAHISDEYLRHLRQSAHVSEEEIGKLWKMRFEEIDFRTTDPRTGKIIAYLFDSWRCVATGTGTCEGDKEIIAWTWSAGGQGTSVRTTERTGDDSLTVTEKYSLPDGGAMEDRVRMVRKK